jgi:hypothetical protein
MSELQDLKGALLVGLSPWNPGNFVKKPMKNDFSLIYINDSWHFSQSF